jgi:hypothetical protein
VRHLFQDHFVKPRTTLEELSNGTFLEFGDFVDQPYHLKETRPDGITLEREGGIYVEGKRRPLLVIKNYQLVPSGGWTVTYELKNTGPLPINVHFVVENNYTCLAGDSALRVVKWNGTSRQCGEKFEIKSREKLQIQDSARGLDWTWNVSPAAQVLHYPVHTVSLQGDQPKQDYQGSALLFAWPVYLTAGDSLRFELQCQLRSLTELTAKKQENT